MPNSKQARLNRLLRSGRCLDIAIDHGVCNEPSFLAGLEDMPSVIDRLVAAAPDAIQLALCRRSTGGTVRFER